MNNLEAAALKATGTTRTLFTPPQRVVLGNPTAAQGRHVGLTGEGHESRTTWVHVSPEGAWEGHSAGAFELTRDVFAQCAVALRACETPPPVDYEHASLRELDGQPTPAAGYIHDLATREDGLWALVEFTQRAAEMVRGGEYRFCSGVFVWDAPDRATGEPIPCQLDSIGLTNKPFIDGQHAIRLTRVIGASMEISKKDFLAKLDALVKGSTVTADELKAVVEFLEKSQKPEEPEIEVEVEEAPAAPLAAASPDAAACAVPPPAAPPAAAPLAAPPPAEMPAAGITDQAAAQATEDGDAAGMLLTKLVGLTMLDSASLLASVDANAEQIKGAFLGADGGQMPYSALSAKVDAQDAVIASMSADLAKYRDAEAKRTDEAIVAEVDTLVAAGKVLAGDRGKFLTLARKAPVEFRAMTATLPVVVPMGRDVPKVGPSAANSNGLLANAIDESNPRFVELTKHYNDPRNPWAQHFPKSGKERDEAIRRVVINQLKKEQPISG